MKKIAIMQPTYLPWIGYFSLMEQVDTFVFLDSVQFARRSWQQRNRIKTAHGLQMLTVPVVKKDRYEQKIKDAEIESTANFSKDHIRAIQTSYAKSHFYKEYSPRIFLILEKSPVKLSALTRGLILTLKDILGIKCPCVCSSDLEITGAKDELLANICARLSADVYLSPVGSKVYLDDSLALPKKNIKLLYNNFNHPTYKQLSGDFVPFLSVIDLIFNEGPRSLDIIRAGILPPVEDEQVMQKSVDD